MFLRKFRRKTQRVVASLGKSLSLTVVPSDIPNFVKRNRTVFSPKIKATIQKFPHGGIKNIRETFQGERIVGNL